MPPTFDFDQIGRLPASSDNVAIATRKLDAGDRVTCLPACALRAGKRAPHRQVCKNTRFTLSHTILEGHRFAVHPIAAGEALLSWGLPFGIATRTIGPGDYACNPQILEALRLRNLDFELPSRPNFQDRIEPCVLDEQRLKPGVQVSSYPQPRTFKGYRRAPSRGVGTRNNIVILGTTSRTASFARRLEERLKGLSDAYENIDNIVAVAHTEGGGGERPNNLDLLLRTLAGFIVHPNVGAVLAVDYGTEPLTNKMLRTCMEAEGYPLREVVHEFLTLKGGFQENLDMGEAIVKGWLDTVNRTSRTDESAAHLKIALQCGGSDAFSGISGNPLVAWVARETIRYGGCANLAETDELIGAESYILQNVKDLDTARRFLDTIQHYKDLAAWHGTTAEGNPSGGNKFRGLYNIVLKSIGAAQKRHPDIRLDEVIAYAEPMRAPGYYFMDSPGNDLESVAGQVASGCNMIFFVTGNGSITNFPFVPTLKIITTTARYDLLSNEMDVNAGAYLDGTPMDDLGRQMLGLTLDVASGALSKGERAGHAQVSLWRNWRQTDTRDLERLLALPRPGGVPIPIRTDPRHSALTFNAIHTPKGPTTDRIGLILPTSLCSGQIARMGAERLTQKGLGCAQGISRFVALAHTEGCGVAGESAERFYNRTMLGYLTHPLVACGLLLEHGCEKTHNDYMRHELEALSIDPATFGWASVQLDGGIERVLQKVEAWFASQLAREGAPLEEPAGLDALRLGLLTSGPLSDTAARSLAGLTRTLVGAGGTVIVPETAGLLASPPYLKSTLGDRPPGASLGHGQRAEAPGFYIMETQTDHWVEILTGLGATGVEILLAHTAEHPMQGHPLLPMLQVTASTRAVYGGDIDLYLGENPAENVDGILRLILSVASRTCTPRANIQGNTDFQFTRGLLGVSM